MAGLWVLKGGGKLAWDGFCRAGRVLQNPAVDDGSNRHRSMLSVVGMAEDEVRARCHGGSVQVACWDVVSSLKWSLFVRSEVKNRRRGR